jgi:A118 family predicted phage portal protein
MALPVGGDKVPWPPKEAQPYYMRYSEHSAWYDGSPLALAAFYGGFGGSQLGGQSLGFFNQNLTYPEPTNQAAPLWRRFMFWSKQPSTPVTRSRIHVPIAADIATTSADLMFSEEPTFTIAEAQMKGAEQGAKDVQARLDAINEDGGIYTQLLEAAEVCAALGGVFLKCGWDRDLMEMPLLTAVHADAAVPEFLWGRLTAVTFWRVVLQDANVVWRHLERHEKGQILHGLYQGDPRNLGKLVPLTESPVTADLAGQLTEGNAIDTQLPDRLTAVYIPNMRPNRSDRASSLGRSDYAGVEGLMDALDETYTSWMRDIRLARARLIVPAEYLRSEGKGKGADFDSDREIWQSLEMDPTKLTTSPIVESQFKIRTQEHELTALNLTERIIAAAGYSGSTFGIKGEGTIKTATEIAAREQRSLVTRGKKAQFWGPQLQNILQTMLMLDAKLFDGPGVYKPRVEFSDSVRDDPKEIATGVQLLLAAKAASTETRVRMVHPDWSDDEVTMEVKDLLAEGSGGVPSIITGGEPTRGNLPPAPGPVPGPIPPVAPGPGVAPQPGLPPELAPPIPGSPNPSADGTLSGRQGEP